MKMNKTIFIRYQDEIPITVNTYIAEYGFRRLGYEVYRFTKDEVTDWISESLEQLKLLRSYIFVGGTHSLLKIIDLMQVHKPLTYNPHEYLPGYCNRNIYRTTLAKAREITKAGCDPFFMKPAEDTKVFTGYVVRSEIDLLKINSLSDELPILISDIMDIKSEYRCFVNRKNLLDIRHYNGDFRLFPNFNIIEQAIKDFTNQPVSYTLDFAILADGSMALIEINDGYALGYCGIHPVPYCKFLEDRWMEIASNIIY